VRLRLRVAPAGVVVVQVRRCCQSRSRLCSRRRIWLGLRLGVGVGAGRVRVRVRVRARRQAVLERAHVERGALTAVLQRRGEQRVAESAQLRVIVLGGGAASC